jgi:membrane protease YdiL (CAAX protease family)
MAARIAWIVALIALAVVVIFNQLDHLKPAPPAAVPSVEFEPPQTNDPFALTSKLLVKLNHVMAASGGTSDTTRTLARQVDASAQTHLDRLRSSLVIGELLGSEAGLERIERLEKDPGFQAKVTEGNITSLRIQQQADLFRAVLKASPPVMDSLTLEQRELLASEHGWYHTLAAVRGLDAANASRASVMKGGMRILVGTSLFIFVIVATVLGALASCITMVVLLATGKIRPRFVPPVPGGSVFIETLALFIVGFLLLSVILPLVMERVGAGAWYTLEVRFILQWSLLAVCLWPMVRGLTFRELRLRLGWTGRSGPSDSSGVATGERGGALEVLREACIGIFAYLSFLPILAAVLVITYLLIVLMGKLSWGGGGGQGGSELPSNPIIDIMLQGSPLQLALFFVLATCWAPVVEEAIFRGALFRHMRSSLPLVVCTGVTAVLFGVMHGYHVIMLGPVIALGASFALMREWRGSLVAPMTAHFLHNGTLVTLMMIILPALAD